MRDFAALRIAACLVVLASVVLAGASAVADVHATPQRPAAGVAQAEQPAPEPNAAKLAVVSSVDRHAADLAALSDRIWAYAEIALREDRLMCPSTRWPKKMSGTGNPCTYGS